MNNDVVKNEIESDNIKELIYEIRGKQVMLDMHVAMLYHYLTKRINETVSRNSNRFPENFCFQLTEREVEMNWSQFATSSKNDNNKHRGKKYLPYAFTEQGIAMLSGLLKNDIAIKVSINIMNAFVEMRKYISTNLLEQKYINNQVMKNTEDIKLLQESFQKLEEKKKVNEIYFDGQIFDAYSKIYEIFNSAKKKLIIIDSYADNTILDIIKRLSIEVTIVTKENNLLTKQDIMKYNKQYHNLKVIYNNTFHDRYFIIDEQEIYHCGASINRIGYKTFSITLINDDYVCKILMSKINKILCA